MVDEDLSQLRIEKKERSSTRGKRGKYLFLCAAVVVVAGLGVLYKKGMLQLAVEVQVASVQNVYPAQTFTLLNASGYVVAQRKAAVASKITGRLVFLGVEEGNRVKKGELIARLENDDALAARDRVSADVRAAQFNLEQSKAELEDATLDYNRKRDLTEKDIIARSELDSVQARYKKAKAAVAAHAAMLRSRRAALREAEVTLEYTNIRAPFDAVVLTKNADIGDIVTPIGAAADAKAAVVTIADMDSLQVEVDVSESNIEQVRVGQPCEIQLDALPDDRFGGRVHMIVPTADRTKASVMVKVAFVENHPGILPEMSAKVAFLSRKILPEEQQPLKAVPSSAIIESGGQNVVFVVQGDMAFRTVVQVGRRLGDMTEILESPELGSRVVLSPTRGIKNGTRIKIRQE